MSRNVSPRSAKVVAFLSLGAAPVAIYPDAISAARIIGCSRQAISKAIKTKTTVKGYYFLKYYDYINQPKAQESHR